MWQRFHILSGRGGKDIDSIENVDRVKKLSDLITFSNLPVEGGQNVFIFYVSEVQHFSIALRGGLRNFAMSFWIRLPPTAKL